MPFFPRFTARKEAATPGAASRPTCRACSPSRGSTLMTSAPMSASSMLAKGPAITWV